MCLCVCSACSFVCLFVWSVVCVHVVIVVLLCVRAFSFHVSLFCLVVCVCFFLCSACVLVGLA